MKKPTDRLDLPAPATTTMKYKEYKDPQPLHTIRGAARVAKEIKARQILPKETENTEPRVNPRDLKASKKDTTIRQKEEKKIPKESTTVRATQVNLLL